MQAIGAVPLLLSCLVACPAGGPAPEGKGAPKGPEIITMGKLRYDPGKQQIELDGTINCNRGYIEFLATLPGVKDHETVLAVDCRPSILKAALLLMGLKEGKPPESDVDIRPIEGDRVVIILEWMGRDAQGQPARKSLRAEDCIINGLAEKPMARTGWVFHGSRFYKREDGGGEVFLADLEGFLVSVSHRPGAILDNPVGLPYPDGEYHANPEILPVPDFDNPVPVKMIIRRPNKGEIDTSVNLMPVKKVKERKGKEEPADQGKEP